MAHTCLQAPILLIPAQWGEEFEAFSLFTENWHCRLKTCFEMDAGGLMKGLLQSWISRKTTCLRTFLSNHPLWGNQWVMVSLPPNPSNNHGMVACCATYLGMLLPVVKASWRIAVGFYSIFEKIASNTPQCECIVWCYLWWQAVVHSQLQMSMVL